MKRCILFFTLLLLPATLFGQWALSGRPGTALNRIDQAFRTNSPASIMDMYGGTVTLRLGDSLYTDISGITASQLVNRFFKSIQVVSFQEGLPGSALMIYSQNGKQDTTHVDVWLQRAMGGPEIRAVNISNYPLATVFFDLHKSD